MANKRKTDYYVLMIWGDVEPQLHGPFGTSELRDKKAHELYHKESSTHGYYRLEVPRGTPVKIETYSGAEMDACNDEADHRNNTGNWYFSVSSPEYGSQEHGPYDSSSDAIKGIKRVKNKARKLKDTILRTYSQPYQK